VKFAVIGIDHAHIFDHVNGLLGEGLKFAGYDPASSVPTLVQTFAEKYPHAPQRHRDELFDDPDIDIICTAAIPRDRTSIAVRAMRGGKDVMADKPGVVSFEQLEEARRAVAETGRIFSICFSERLCVPAAVKAGKLVRAGAIGRVVQTIGMGPHRKSADSRPDWFFELDAFGGIIVDIASHQIDQFLFFTGSAEADVVASTVGNFDTPQSTDFQDFGELLVRSPHAAGYIRVDWYTPDGLPTWGDGRLTILGTKGYIELRKYVDIAGREGGNHLFLVDQDGVRHIECSHEKLDYFAQFVDDVRNRTETAMAQSHVFEVCRLSLEAQRKAAVIGPPAR
jgi:predicted dehydrogenase